MKSRKSENKTMAGRVNTTKPRFKIHKLEERIAPKYFYNPNSGKYVGNGGDSPPCNGGRYHAGKCK